MFLAPARNCDLGSPARASNVNCQIARVARALMTSTHALVVFATKWPVANLIARRTGTGAALNSSKNNL
jgi:hypothetical protein